MTTNEDPWVDDSRLTAYALGELPDDELPDVLALVEQSPTSRDAVDEIRRLGVELRECRAAEATESASAELRAMLSARFGGSGQSSPTMAPSPPALQRETRRHLFSIAVAVTVLVGVTLALHRVGQWQTDEATITAKLDASSAYGKARTATSDLAHRRTPSTAGSRGYRVGHDENHAEDFTIDVPELTEMDERDVTISGTKVELSQEGIGDGPFGGDLAIEGTGQPQPDASESRFPARSLHDDIYDFGGEGGQEGGEAAGGRARLDADDGGLLDEVIAEGGGQIDAVQQRQNVITQAVKGDIARALNKARGRSSGRQIGGSVAAVRRSGGGGNANEQIADDDLTWRDFGPGEGRNGDVAAGHWRGGRTPGTPSSEPGESAEDGRLLPEETRRKLAEALSEAEDAITQYNLQARPADQSATIGPETDPASNADDGRVSNTELDTDLAGFQKHLAEFGKEVAKKQVEILRIREESAWLESTAERLRETRNQLSTWKDLETLPEEERERQQGLRHELLRKMAAAEHAIAAIRGPDSKPGHKAKRPATWRRSRKVPNTSRLMVGERAELTLEGMQVNVQIDGFRARVLLDCYYYNDHDRQLEGNFQLRLPNEASLYFFAFGETAYGPKDGARPPVRQAFFNVSDVRKQGMKPVAIMRARQDSWREPKEARMVTRTKAAHAYRETVRRRVDPALVEWSGAGVFSSRVFPLMPNRLHRIVIGYDVNLLRIGPDLLYGLDLPDHVGECTVDVNVRAMGDAKAEIAPEAKPFTAAGRAYFHYDRPQHRHFEVRLADAGNVLVRGEDPDTGPFFAASLRPQLPVSDPVAGAADAVFLVDTSLSANPEKFNVWAALLKATLNNNRDSIKQFAVLLFNVEQHWWQKQFVANTPQNIAALDKHLHTLALEGATDLGQALRQAAAPEWDRTESRQRAPRDYFLLSDGAITWGERNTEMLVRSVKPNGPVFMYRTGLAGTDVRTLTQLARATGGALFTVAGDAQIEVASRAHRQRPWQLLDVDVEGGSDVMLAGRPKTLFPGQQVLLVGRGIPSDAATVALKLRRAGKQMTVRVPIDRQVESDLAARCYGQAVVRGLEELVEDTEDVATAYARHFRITGRTCSLLMLESEADYQRFNIKPEDDAFVVKSTAARDVIAGAEDHLAATLGDPKQQFVAWLRALGSTPGLQLEISPALKVAIDRMPKSAFQVQPRPLRCIERSWESIPESLRELLSVRQFGYDDIMQEASSRQIRAGAADALKVASSLVEQRPGDLALARDVGFSALDWGLGDQAYFLMRHVAVNRPYEPQTYLALAQCLTYMDKIDLAMIHYEIATAGQWDRRFPDFKHISEVDYLHFLRRIQAGELKAHEKNFAEARLDTLSASVNMTDSDLLVTIMWNTDGTDVDLHVVEPTGEECYYQNRTTKIGGKLTQDATQGYGPEMYMVQRAAAGNYQIRAKYFASDQNRLSTRTRVFVTLFEDWGTDRERMVRRTVTLNAGKEMTDIMTVKRAGP